MVKVVGERTVGGSFPIHDADASEFFEQGPRLQRRKKTVDVEEIIIFIFEELDELEELQ